MKVVLNKCYGLFGLSKEAIAMGATLGQDWADAEPSRVCPALVKVVEDLGPRASDEYSSLEVIEIPDETPYEITDYDGLESIGPRTYSWG